MLALTFPRSQPSPARTGRAGSRLSRAAYSQPSGSLMFAMAANVYAYGTRAVLPRG